MFAACHWGIHKGWEWEDIGKGREGVGVYIYAGLVRAICMQVLYMT